MKKLYLKYYDVLLIDSSLEKNRFNMPMVNFVCIDNLGFSRIVAFGLLSDEKQDSYEWLLSKFNEEFPIKEIY